MLGGSNRMLSAQETADMLGVSRQTLYNNWKEWGLKGHKIGRSLKFRERDLEAWLSRQAAA
ncbi:helix-turn-helix domain-containing protein [Nocardiopsis terrae]|uniref:helix-turn-helix domain-containing protein n=1 Tax=Streptomyces sp. NPDC057554 TaxID=3350538 RepID=UPI0036B0CB4C